MTQKIRAKKAKPVDKATPVIRKPKGTDGAKVTVTRSLTSAMKATPQWAASPTLQACTTAWGGAADALESTAKIISDLRTKLGTLAATQRANRQGWNVATKQLIATAQVVCEGSPDLVHAFGFDVLTHGGATAQSAPSGLVALPTTVSGEAVVSWKRGSARHGFIVQHATDVANPATVSAPIPWTRTKYKLEGAQSRSNVCFRVAAIDTTSSTGASPWTDWVTCTVR